MFDQQTLDALRSAGGEGGVSLDPTFEDPPWRARWVTEGGPRFVAYGDSEGQALDSLLLVMTGKGDEVDKTLRLKLAIRHEAEAQAAYDAAKAEREAVENETAEIEVKGG